MRLTLDLRKSLEENASDYFDKAKKARSKISGAKKAILKASEQAKNAPVVTLTRQAPKKIRKKAWFEKFKWFFASNEMLVIAGRDATTNEIVIKKHVDEKDAIFHTDAPGSPFVVIKAEKAKIPKEVLQEAADFCACHSRAWKRGVSDTEVYWVTPEQVTKEAKAGEYVPKGAFMVYGKRNYVKPKMELAACSYEDTIMIAPVSSIDSKNPEKKVIIKIGSTKVSDAAKKIVKTLGAGEVDDVVRSLPGTCSVKEVK